MDVDKTSVPTVEPPVLETVGLTKSYGHVAALRGLDFRAYAGEIVALVGDNGAGKSTFVKTVAGVHHPDEGYMRIDGEVVTFQTALHARQHGIETVFQDLALAPDLPVWANLFLGQELLKKGPARFLGWMDKKAMRRRAQEELDRVKITLPSINALVANLSGGQRQAVAVARSITWGRRLVMMDEPTANLGVAEQERVEGLVRHLSATGVAVLLVSHNLAQVFKLADRIVVLRHGRRVAERACAETTREEVVSWITGALEGDEATA